MQKNVADIIEEICQAKATGILTLSLKNESALFKIFFKNGFVYHITHGTCKDRECLTRVVHYQFMTCMFMPGAHIDTPKNVSPIPCEELMTVFTKAGKTADWSGQWDGRSKSSQTNIESAIVDNATIARIGDELLNLVGPVGTILVANAYNECGLKQGQPIVRSDFERLIRTISRHVPDEHKQSFLVKFA